MTKVSVSIEDPVWDRTIESAKAAGVTPSAYVTRVLRRDQLRQQAETHDAWLADNPQAQTDRDSWRRLTGAMATARRTARASGESRDPRAARAASAARDALAAEVDRRAGTGR